MPASAPRRAATARAEPTRPEDDRGADGAATGFADVAAPAVAAPAVDVSVVIVTYNVREFLEQALESVERASAGLAVETFVVDNDSADGTAARVAERFPDVRLIANTANVGFAVANNQALREARGRYLLVLNPDTLLQEDTLRALVAFMDAHPGAGAVGPRILNPDGTFAPESRRAFPTPAVAFYRISGLGRLFPRSPRFGRYNLTHLPDDAPSEVDALSGSCMMVRRAAVLGEPGAASGEPTDERKEEGGRSEAHSARRTNVERQTSTPSLAAPRLAARRPAGLFDEAFFMYGEDLDWCYRIQQAGWTIHYTPATQIVHYKGESTKKGDLRYVLLFYGAMLRFVEKHVGRRAEAGWGERLGSGALAFALRAGIVVRASLAAVGRLGRRAARPAAEFALAWAALAGVAAVWSAADGFAFDPRYYGLVLPGYAGVLVAAVAGAGGYRRAGARVRAVPVGLGVAVVAVSVVAFFVPALAFSRATVALGYAGAGAVLGLGRWLRRRSDLGPRRVLVVGTAAEAARLRSLVGGQVRPAVEVVGYVAERAEGRRERVPYAGPARQLRALVRLRRADEVVFAADSLTNTAILAAMQDLREAPVALKILASGRDRVIGKASVEDFSAPLLDAERAVAPLAGPRRAVEVPVALAALALGPLVRAAARLRPSPRLRRAAAFSARMPSVLAGRRALVGYDTAGPHPPLAWGLRPGVASILDTLPARPRTITEAHRAYWFYARHRSAWLDLEIVAKALLRES